MSHDLPLYQCIKRVRAAKIISITGPILDTPRRVATDFGTFDAGGSQFDKAVPGWFYVLYADDYASASPPEAFEEGYLLITEEGTKS